MIGGVIPSGIENTNPIINNALAIVAIEPTTISVDAIKSPIKQHNVVIQKAFLYLLRFSLPQFVFPNLSIARIIKTRLAIENMIPTTKVTIFMTKISENAELLGILGSTIMSMI